MRAAEPDRRDATWQITVKLAIGDWVSLHWNWVCDRLSQRQLRALYAYTTRHLDLVNHRVEHSGPAAVL